MPATQVRTQQIGDGTVSRADLNTTVSGSAVIAKAVQGSLMAFTSTGADAGTGDVTINIATLAANTIIANATSGVATPTAFAVNASSLVGRGAIGNITNMTIASPLLLSGTALGLNAAVDLAMTVPQSITNTDSETGGASTPVLTLIHQTTGTPANVLGTPLAFNCETSSVASREQGRIATGWSDVNDATRTAYMDFLLVNNAALPANKMRLFPSGGLSVNHTTDPGAGYVSANTGFKIGTTDIFPVTTARAGTPTLGSAGMALYKNTATSYDYSWKQPVHYQGGSVNTAGTASATAVHAGLAGSITPGVTGRLMIIISGYAQNSTAGLYTAINGIRYGTGTAPAHGAAQTGTLATGSAAAATSATANAFVPFCISAIVSGLSVGTTYWIDTTYNSSTTGGTSKLFVTAISAMEF